MTVFVGILHVDFWMVANTSLKDRRRVIRSVLDRVRARHNVATAEVEPTDDWRRASVAIACVGANHHLLRQVLESIRRQLESEMADEVQAAEIEIR